MWYINATKSCVGNISKNGPSAFCHWGHTPHALLRLDSAAEAVDALTSCPRVFLIKHNNAMIINEKICFYTLYNVVYLQDIRQACGSAPWLLIH